MNTTPGAPRGRTYRQRELHTQRSRGGKGPGCLVWKQGGQSGGQDIDLGEIQWWLGWDVQ